MQDKVCVITGASSGIGKETALGLAKLGARVVLVCRDRGRGEAALAEIKRRVPSTTSSLMLADLASQAAVRQLAADLSARHPRIDVLINNAAVITPKRQVSPDGLEVQLAVNHLAPFLLTNLLLDVLKASAPARVIVVSSQVESRGVIDLDDLQSQGGTYDHLRAYCQSKLANALFTYELARRLHGTGVTANCLHPGVIATNLLSDYMSRPRAVGFLARLEYPGPEAGAKTSIRLASDPALAGVSGKYFRDQREAQSSPASHDEDLAGRLWQASENLTLLAS